MSNYNMETIEKFDKLLKNHDFDALKNVIVNEFSDGLDVNFVDNILRVESISESLSIEKQIEIMKILKDNNAFQTLKARGICIQLSARYGRADLLEIIAESNLDLGLKQSMDVLDLPIVEVRKSKFINEEARKSTIAVLEKYGCKKPHRFNKTKEEIQAIKKANELNKTKDKENQAWHIELDSPSKKKLAKWLASEGQCQIEGEKLLFLPKEIQQLKELLSGYLESMIKEQSTETIGALFNLKLRAGRELVSRLEFIEKTYRRFDLWDKIYLKEQRFPSKGSREVFVFVMEGGDWMNDMACPVCGKNPLDKPCEHTVYVTANECGLIYVAEQYQPQLFLLAEYLLRGKGELEDGESLRMDNFPSEIIPELYDDLEIEDVAYYEGYGVPPSDLFVFAAFVARGSQLPHIHWDPYNRERKKWLQEKIRLGEDDFRKNWKQRLDPPSTGIDDT